MLIKSYKMIEVMKLKIVQIRELLKTKNYLADKSIDISSIKTGKKYHFICEKDHIFESFISDVFQGEQFRCPICSGRRTLRGYNDLWTTHPEIAAMLKNKDDGYKYSAGSNVKLSWVCPDCGNETIHSPNKMTTRKSRCTICSHDTSYPEKFMSHLLNQAHITFKKDKIFEWSDKKRYDFYLPKYNCIIETHGKQHYTNSDFSYLGGKTYIDEQINDNDKMLRATKYGQISNYIIIDCRKSEMDWIKQNILRSKLFEVLQIMPETIDWNECHKFALSNLTKMICEEYEKDSDIHSLCQTFKMSYNAVKAKLKHGSKIGWCSYNPEEARKIAIQENGQRIIETMSMPILQMDMQGNIIKEFPSIQEAQRQLSISHIWDCIVGKRQSAGGYRWKYKIVKGEVL